MSWHDGRMPKPLPLLTPRPTSAAPRWSAPRSPPSRPPTWPAGSRRSPTPTRLRTLSILLASEGMEACTCDLTGPLGLTQPTVTHHLQKLAAAGLVVGERRGTWTWYRVVPEALSGLADAIAPRT